MAGWKALPIEEVPKCVICVAPHTSNWDFILGKLYYTSMGKTASFLIKKDWFIFPFNLFFNWIGGVPVDRSRKTSVTEQMVEQFAKRKVFQLAITPEGTRKRVEEWKKGFYYMALEANVPILMAYFDYAKKKSVPKDSSIRQEMWKRTFTRSGLITEELRESIRKTSYRYKNNQLKRNISPEIFRFLLLNQLLYGRQITYQYDPGSYYLGGQSGEPGIL